MEVVFGYFDAADVQVDELLVFEEGGGQPDEAVMGLDAEGPGGVLWVFYGLWLFEFLLLE
jgi:hypothetical protein